MLYGKPGSDGQRLAVLDCVYELGCKNIDTADAYLDNEDLIGKWLQKNDRRNEVSYYIFWLSLHLLNFSFYLFDPNAELFLISQ